MDNQHRKITGYRELNHHDIALMNEIKSVGNEHLSTILTKVSDELEHRYQSGDFYQNESQYKDGKRWAEIAKTHFQQGLMSLTRSVANPQFF